MLPVEVLLEFSDSTLRQLEKLRKLGLDEKAVSIALMKVCEEKSRQKDSVALWDVTAKCIAYSLLTDGEAIIGYGKPAIVEGDITGEGNGRIDVVWECKFSLKPLDPEREWEMKKKALTRKLKRIPAETLVFCGTYPGEKSGYFGKNPEREWIGEYLRECALEEYCPSDGCYLKDLIKRSRRGKLYLIRDLTGFAEHMALREFPREYQPAIDEISKEIAERINEKIAREIKNLMQTDFKRAYS